MSTVGNWINDLRVELGKLSPKLDPIFSLLEVAQAATGVGGAGAGAALQVLKTAMDAMGQGATGELGAAALAARISELKTELTTAFPAIEAQQDADLTAKFPAS